MKLKLSILILNFFFCFILNAQKLTLGELFSEGTVMQRNTEVEIWGNSFNLETVFGMRCKSD